MTDWLNTKSLDCINILSSDRIEIYSYNNVDLKTIHQKVMENIKDSMKRKEELLKKLECSHSVIEKDIVQNALKGVDVNEKFETYKKNTKDILKEFVKGIKISEANNKIFISEASKIIDISLRIKLEHNLCSNCRKELNIGSTNGTDYCDYCGIIVTNLAKYKQKEDQQPYDSKENFMNAHKRFQGKETPATFKTLSIEEIIQRLDKYFLSFQKPPSAYYIEKELNKYGEREGTSLNMLKAAILNCELNGLLDHSRLIAKLYWNWELEDLSEYDEKIMEHYRIFRETFDKIEKTRKNSLNVDFHLYKEYKMLGIRCKKEHFKLIETDETIGEQEEIWDKICELNKHLGFVNK